MKHFQSTTNQGLYSLNGIRLDRQFTCRITNAARTAGHTNTYIAKGSFVGNKLTPDANSNRRLDVFRCKMEDAQRAYLDLARGSDEVVVEVLRGSTSLIKFRVPWRERKVGFMLSQPADAGATAFDPWKGFNRTRPGVWTHDRVHMCVPGWEDLPTKASMPLLVEWTQHHLMQGEVRPYLSPALSSPCLIPI